MFNVIYPNFFKFVERRNAINALISHEIIDLTKPLSDEQVDEMLMEIDECLAPERVSHDGELSALECQDNYDYYLACWNELCKLTGRKGKPSNA